MFNNLQKQDMAAMVAEERAKQTAHQKQERQEREARKVSWQNPENRQKWGEMSSTAISAFEADLQAKLQSIDGKEKQQADYNIKTSPVTHLQPTAKRSITTKLQMLNPSFEASDAAAIMNILGSAVGTDEQGKWKTGVNGRRGAGAAKFKPFGRDIDNNFIVELPTSNDPNNPNMQKIIVDPTSMALLEEARLKAYRAAVEWEKANKAAIAKAQEKGPFTRALEMFIPPQGVPSPRGP
jgi:hypothetical protein